MQCLEKSGYAKIGVSRVHIRIRIRKSFDQRLQKYFSDFFLFLTKVSIFEKKNPISAKGFDF